MHKENKWFLGWKSITVVTLEPGHLALLTHDVVSMMSHTRSSHFSASEIEKKSWEWPWKKAKDACTYCQRRCFLSFQENHTECLNKHGCSLFWCHLIWTSSASCKHSQCTATEAYWWQSRGTHHYVPCTSTCNGNQEFWSSKEVLYRLICPLKLPWSLDLAFLASWSLDFL